ncbi:hypothetical protein DDE82_000229 [Stemphylium lycopersici]|uniref:Uncharacterized protein n=1 Tax=Stemphylium lycopersici TaxID=183478 RepID=A0A364N5U2_STELY|nr:hypothetical protein TW65_09203 [Stemphylium lycopersici]RAR12518.1 hypothetical protein DDE82_000229 [Stemphylium lycopersici]RAR12597.1 hypothetical protein DDE83_003994 [Stemphylium lycopersici]
MRLSTFLVPALAGLVFAADSSTGPAATASSIASSITYSISSEASSVASSIASKTAIEGMSSTATGTGIQETATQTGAAAVGAGDVDGVMIAVLGVVAWMW